MSKQLSKFAFACLLPAVLLLFSSACDSFRDSAEDKKAKADKQAEETAKKISDVVFLPTGDKKNISLHSDGKSDETAVKDAVTTDKVLLPELPHDKKSDKELSKQSDGSMDQKVPERQKPFYDQFLTDESGAENTEIALTFDAASLADILPAFSQALKFSYILDAQVKGAVTMTVNTKMSKRELWQMFEQILWISGAYCSPEGQILHILPFAKMPQERRLLVKHLPSANTEVALVSLRNAASKDIMEKIRPFLTEGATSIEIPHQNAILLVETPDNIPKLRELIDLLDRKNKADWPQLVIPCANVSATRIKNELAVMLPVLGFPVTIDNVVADPGSIHLIALERPQVIVASAANNEALEELRTWVGILDRSDVGSQEQVYIYRVVNNKADDLLQAISAIFTVEATSLSVNATGSTGNTTNRNASTSTNNRNTTNTANRNATTTTNTANRSTTGGPNTNTAAVKSGQGANADGPASVFDLPVKIFADGVQNRLIIRTVPRTYAMINAIMKRIDTAASQVLLQVLISEISLTDNTQFGIEFSDKQSSDKQKVNSVFGTNYSSLAPGSADDQGFTYALSNFSNPDQKFAYLRALADNSKIKVLSAPQIVVQSHSQAQINVGDSVPTITNQITDTASSSTTSTTLNQAIEYVDTGIILTVTPHVTIGGLITIDLQQEVSDAVPNTTSTIDSPIIQKRIITTTMSIRDGSTLIVAGLIRNRSSDTLSSVPFISKIPLLGRLFGDSEIETKKTELVMMITGKIITEESKLEEMIRRYKESTQNILKTLSDQDEENKGAKDEPNPGN